MDCRLHGRPLFISYCKRRMKITLKHKITGEFKEVGIGWSWSLLMFSGLFGLPLYLRGLDEFGRIFFAISASIYTLVFLSLFYPDSGLLYTLFSLIGFILIVMSLISASVGNAFTNLRMLDNGWEFSEPDSDSTDLARKNLGLDAAKAKLAPPSE